MATWRYQICLLMLRVFHLFTVLTWMKYFSSLERNFSGVEWFLKKHGSQKILAQPQHLGSICEGSQSLVFRWFCISEAQFFLKYQSWIAVSQSVEFTISYLHFCTSMWPFSILYVSHWTLNFLLCFSTELDVEDFDAFLEKVKARSLGNSPFACKFRLALRNLWKLYFAWFIQQQTNKF